ncbi:MULTISPECIES: 2OG-Fe(II) oxygenase family protein [unclassified Novosphingobium]|uniref:2OG-Fe(II) oxygenase n=1 Tax=unclassified Novosphingobium TaxID=2644732 RepID=UPI00146CBE1A|nr:MULTISPECIES: 2OG-Fe(II) oxygenase family protein [unclassified Novosphingobium]NMN03519.1 Rps23 Pro-64 3,4-dihydroxylase Tpa1-like proline 4-hydroxylase [Novosphingobium sp. SG919]NMN86491.1 Rps23 Pro-64 3,4-dihydroxylase Tpa1-like proline 4-hydroxylase [Novosphingobium sp. SG916]
MANPFSPAITPAACQAATATLAASGHVRLAPVLPAATADALHRWMSEEAAFSRVLNQGDKVWDLDAKARAALDPQRQAALLDAVHAQARDGFQFLFDSLRVSDDPAERAARNWPVDRLVSAFNTPPWLDLFRTLTGEPAIRLVDGQATRYLPGHFLTCHDDNVAGKNRVAAYVLNLTPQWRVEWGGLLMFHDDAGDVQRALAPRHNALHLFRVPQRHSVSQVTPFAGAPRLAITGWLRR